MRYSIVTLIAGILTSTVVLAASADQLSATKHNFTVAGNYSALGTNSTICQPCHTPHHAIVDSSVSSRLWNHKMSTATYTLYEGDTASATLAADGVSTADDSQGMDRVSRLCLGCHDGQVALDAFGTLANNYNRDQDTVHWLTGDASNLGVDFRDDHPVGVDAKATDSAGALLSGSHLKTPTISYVKDEAGNDTTTISSVKIGSLSLAKLNSSYYSVGCKTCHNPHGAGTTAGQPYPHLLAQPASGLCNNCHTK